MLSIMYDVLTDANLDSQQRVVEMLKESKVLYTLSHAVVDVPATSYHQRVRGGRSWCGCCCVRMQIRRTTAPIR